LVLNTMVAKLEKLTSLTTEFHTMVQGVEHRLAVVESGNSADLEAKVTLLESRMASLESQQRMFSRQGVGTPGDVSTELGGAGGSGGRGQMAPSFARHERFRDVAGGYAGDRFASPLSGGSFAGESINGGHEHDHERTGGGLHDLNGSIAKLEQSVRSDYSARPTPTERIDSPPPFTESVSSFHPPTSSSPKRPISRLLSNGLGEP
jgi:hypothetical protein